MSFIPKNPLIMPEVESSPSTPLAGTRGLFAGKDGWYEIDGNNNQKKILTADDEDTPKQAIRFTHDISIESDEEGLHLVKNGTKSLLYDSTGSICADSARWAGTSDVASSAEMDRNNNYIDETYATKAEIQAVNGLKYYGDADIVPSEDSLFDYFLNADEKSYSIRMGENPLPKSIVIPYEYNGLPVTSIGEYAFSECASITHVTIPNSVTIIGDFSFYVCNKIAHLTLPDSLTSIGEYAFADCHALTEISVPYGVTFIGNAAFMNCNSLKTIAIPDTVSFMGYGVFLQCTSLENLTIGEGITLIDEDTISGCDSLSDVYYKGTKEQWESIRISVNNESLEEATIHYDVPSSLDEAVKEIVSLRSIIDQLYTKSVVKTAVMRLEAPYWEQVGNSRYCQSVVIKGVTANSKVDLQPTPEQLMIFYEKDITFVTENYDGYVTVYCIGQRPANDYDIQVTITEVER